MASILLVDNETEWLDLIREALPEYDVGQAQTYNAALALLRDNGATYDVAIVDLHLLPAGTDRLGGVILELMRDRYPSIRRIALTGSSPTAIKALFDRYELDDLLLKSRIDLAVVREVVGAALAQVTGAVPRGLRAETSGMLTSLRSWKADIMAGLDQRARTLRNDVLDAQREGKKAEYSERELEALEATKRNLEAEYSELSKLISGIRADQEMARASLEFEQLKNKYEH
jgi:CheY-like chemotaxis protein